MTPLLRRLFREKLTSVPQTSLVNELGNVTVDVPANGAGYVYDYSLFRRTWQKILKENAQVTD